MLKLLSSDKSIVGEHATAYVSKLNEALQLLQGQGVPTKSIDETIFASITLLVGSIVLAIDFGHVAILISNFSANSTTFQRKMESIFAIMNKLQFPVPLRERIHQYYEHLWREYESLDGDIIGFSKGLSHSLELEVMLFKYMDLVSQVPFWRDGSSDFQKALILSLQVRVYVPDDFIIRRGEVGDEYYMINRGVCELVKDFGGRDNTPHLGGIMLDEDPVTSSDQPAEEGNSVDRYPKRPMTSRRERESQIHEAGSENIQVLTRGQSFGEVALILNYERVSNVRALTYVEMCVLKRADMQRILVRHPKDRAEVISNFLMRRTADITSLPANSKESAATLPGQKWPSYVQKHTRYPVDTNCLLEAAVVGVGDDSSIKYGISGHLRERLRHKLSSESPEVASTGSSDAKCIRTIGPLISSGAVGSSFNTLMKRLDEFQASQHEILVALEALRDEFRSRRDEYECK